MNRLTGPLRLARTALALLGLTLLVPGVAQAQTSYKLQPIIRLGDTAGDVPISPRLGFFLGPLNDQGQLLIDAGTLDGSRPDILLEYAAGTFVPILVAGQEGPAGKWPRDVFLTGPGPQGMNERGNVVFAVSARSTGLSGTFFWDAQTQKATALSLKGTPAVNTLQFTEGFGGIPEINNRDEVALVASVKDPAGPSGPALFFVGHDRRLVPILLPGQELPGGGKVRADHDILPSITDGGAVAFLARRQGEKQNSAYLWEQGALTPVVVVGADAPGGGKVTSVSEVLVNHSDRTVVVAAGIDGSRRQGLYRVADGKLTAVAVPGQEMPGGGTLRTLQPVFTGNDGQFACFGISGPSRLGQHAVVATLEDGTTAAYRLDANGQLSLILRSGTSTALGTVTKVAGDQAGLNGKGQVALVVQIDGGPDTVVLLTPTTP